MSRPRRSSERGFTILECEIALLVLTLAVVFMMKMISSHDVLLQDMDEWLVGDTPTWYMVPRDAPYERFLEHAADLSPTPPTGPPGMTTSGSAYQVSILSKTRELHPPTLSVLVQLRKK